jgi:hypothetical protein
LVRSIWFARIFFYLALSATAVAALVYFNQHYASAAFAVLPLFIVSLIPFLSAPFVSGRAKPYSVFPLWLALAGAVVLKLRWSYFKGV